MSEAENIALDNQIQLPMRAIRHEPFFAMTANVRKYTVLRNKMPFDTVSLGYCTLTLFKAGDLAEAQAGYSAAPDGQDLTGNGTGSWKAGWMVIGFEDMLGNPIFIDTADNDLPVFTAMHGMGRWDPEKLARRFPDFVRALEVVREVAVGRGCPAGLEERPIGLLKRMSTLYRIWRLVPGTSLLFWWLWMKA